MLYHWFFFSLFVFRLKWPCLLKIRCELIFQYFETWAWLVNDFLFPLHCIFSSILLHYKERSNHYCKEEWSRVEMKMAKKGVCNWVKVAWCYKFNLIDRFIILHITRWWKSKLGTTGCPNKFWISNSCKIRILKLVKKIRQIEGRSALLSYNVNKLSRIFSLSVKISYFRFFSKKSSNWREICTAVL